LVNLVRSAGAGLGQGSIWGLYIVVLFGYLAYLSYLRLQEYGRGPWW
jgi:hypothetical protein